MSVAVAPYRHEAFNGLYLVKEAGNDLQAKGGGVMIHDEFGPLFLKHGIEEKFGLGLLHRHFDMEPSERLVELNNISTPWDETDAQSIGGALLSHSWDALLSTFGEFLAELYAKLRALGLDKTLGLRAHPGPDFDGLVEVTVGRANINFHPSEASGNNSLSGLVQVLTIFDADAC
ncbi:hypothetical protein M413DRAFT_28156 [Hebeloma cylindrosporum]|uniref:Uncharacterized protein n=1 Tax=Hebeloma cylindrosporum TaxID=76867 RepID=A0A0C3BWU0_HEBCY|nr:hypothetical protein M413DRAFT_28156 [Hebeloma cylindrosporum h7]